MIGGRRIVVVLPAYNAESTLLRTVREIPPGIADEILLVDDASQDGTVRLARTLGLRTFTHSRNLGYGANQKRCYREALALGADIVVMLHPDYQYSPAALPQLAGPVAEGRFDLVLGSRILRGGALAGGMPLHKYVGNRILTWLQNRLLGAHLSEYHTGYRAFSRRVLETIPLERNSDDFLFDNQVLCQALDAGFRIGEVPVPTRYFPEASSITFARSVRYGAGVVGTTLLVVACRAGIAKSDLFPSALRGAAREREGSPRAM